MEWIYLLVGLVVGLIAGIILFKFMKGNDGMSLMENQLRSIQDEKESLSAKTERLEKELGVLQVDASGLEKDLTYSREILAQKEEDIQRIKLEFKERKEAFQTEIVETKTQLQKEFQLLANSILEDKGKRFTEINNDKIGSLIKPLQKDIEQFKKRVDEVYGQEQKERGSLENHLNQLLTLNKELNEGAKNLTKALKGDSKSQGDWGELQLEVILEKAGLNKGVHFETQATFRDDEGFLKKPDFIIHMPENKVLILDSKVSLTAYERYNSAEDKTLQELELKAHVESLRKHIKDLGSKNYEDLVSKTPDFVLMFVPIEPALNAALASNQGLYEEALKVNVVLVSTTTLLATMRTVSYIWTQEDQRQNIQEIIKKTSALYDKFSGFVGDLQKVEKHLNDGLSAHGDAMKKLSSGRGNLIRKVEDIRQLSNYKPKKAIDERLIANSQETDNQQED
ncbi:MAG: DNA recombination protein RmuC [Flavobacteriales bacterium]|nr:DNA recombination protein RmuC [Flavobacteriales bacterium]MDG2245406.1 DNA recombination protein RmuC [Flavobacteriales bacterium]